MRLVNRAIFAVDLQRRPVRSTEPEDEKFLFRFIADIEFLILALHRLRRAAGLCLHVPPISAEIDNALRVFDAALPKLSLMRNVLEHIEDYALDKGHDKAVGRRVLEVSKWDGTTYKWLNHSLNIDEAHQAALVLYSAVRDAGKNHPNLASALKSSLHPR